MHERKYCSHDILFAPLKYESLLFPSFPFVEKGFYIHFTSLPFRFMHSNKNNQTFPAAKF